MNNLLVVTVICFVCALMTTACSTVHPIKISLNLSPTAIVFAKNISKSFKGLE